MRIHEIFYLTIIQLFLIYSRVFNVFLKINKLWVFFLFWQFQWINEYAANGTQQLQFFIFFMVQFPGYVSHTRVHGWSHGYVRLSDTETTQISVRRDNDCYSSWSQNFETFICEICFINTFYLLTYYNKKISLLFHTPLHLTYKVFCMVTKQLLNFLSPL